jgi:Flp pilus assembly protein TadG
MGLWAHQPRRRRRQQRGAVLIEAAIVMPLLITLVMGIIEFGMVFSDMQTVGSATRAGVRSGVAYSRQDAFDEQAVDAVASALTARTTGEPLELWIYQVEREADNAVGFDAGAPVGHPTFDDCTTRCLKYTWDTVNDLWVLDTSTSWDAGDQNACSLPLDQMGVRIKVRHDMVTGLFGDSITLTDKTVMRLEPQPLSVCP